MSWHLAGGVAVVTGAASGIGRALARGLARERVALALCDVNERGLAETAAAAEACASGQQITTGIVDVGDPEQMRRFADQVLVAHGRVTLVVNNAGVALHGRFDQIALDEIERLLRTNFWGVVYGCKMFLPALARERYAHIVNLSSVFGLIAPAGQTAYAASKFAVRGFSEGLRHELAGSNVGLTCVYPGGIRTRIAQDAPVARGAAGSREGYISAFDRLAKHSPEFAAAKILAGVKKKKSRVLIGAEAYALDRIQRLAPAQYGRFLAVLLRDRP